MRKKYLRAGRGGMGMTIQTSQANAVDHLHGIRSVVLCELQGRQ